MNFKDKQLTCKDCKKPFVFTVSEQERYADMKYSPPARCPDCRRKRRLTNQNTRRKTSRQKGRRK